MKLITPQSILSVVFSLFISFNSFSQCPAGSSTYILTDSDPTDLSNWENNGGGALANFSANNICYLLSSSFLMLLSSGVDAELTSDWVITGSNCGIQLPGISSLDNKDFSISWPSDFELYIADGAVWTYSKSSAKSTTDFLFEDLVFLEGEVVITGNGSLAHALNLGGNSFPDGTLTLNVAGVSGNDDLVVSNSLSIGTINTKGTHRTRLQSGTEITVTSLFNNENTSEDPFFSSSSGDGNIYLGNVALSGASEAFLGTQKTNYTCSGTLTFDGDCIWQLGTDQFVQFNPAATVVLEESTGSDDGGVLFSEDFIFVAGDDVEIEITSNANALKKITVEDGASLLLTHGSIDSLLVEGEVQISNTGAVPLQLNGQLDIQNGGVFVVNTASECEVKDGAVYVDGSSSLVQLGTGELNVIGTNSPAEITISSSFSGTDWGTYTYWSSPIQNQALSIANYMSYVYTDRGEGLDDWTPYYSAMQVGRGYALNQAESGVVFSGLPYTGTLSTGTPEVGPVTGGRSESWTLVGNPYPGGLHAATFLNDFDNSSSIQGAVYIWDQDKSSAVWDGFESSDYTAINGTGASWVGDEFSDTTDASNYMIAPFQGFFVEGQGAFVSNVVYTNAMRDPALVGSYEHGFKSAENKKKLWLKVEQGLTKSTCLIGFIGGATDQWDRQYDASPLGGELSVTSLVGEKPAMIQGLPPFSVDDTVLVRVKLQEKTQNFTLGVEQLFGFESDQEIWIKEIQNGNYYKLSDGDVQLGGSTTSAELNFQLLFQEPSVVSVENNPTREYFSELLKFENGAVQFFEDGVVTFTDVLGRLIEKRKVNSEESIILDEGAVNFVLFHSQSGESSVLRVIKK